MSFKTASNTLKSTLMGTIKTLEDIRLPGEYNRNLVGDLNALINLLVCLQLSSSLIEIS